ncbi:MULTISPECIES: helix-turn-helix domain-containing protein [unclassified Polaribacter]|uniref:helix-turn-helix domain-containing protein n=1 Tax=unclassified Polaribacter TaxID=196858 RepID=UPI0011BE31EF|nr:MULTISPECIES: helix-turn-helix transcriptional regulator [unclassified Polaribacter]TXD49576.1 helix-turn-helix transcriptional regulator [Polaribacter sp. IC063]TXD58264.1 helix-turn-helix transcriptional regulator [Polaribacter sp. IC066]
MINSLEFTTRIKKVMDFNELTASMFADKIGVQRSSISHILSGRNKPSLDFVLKIISEFKDVDLYWLLNGVGSFPKKAENKSNASAPSLFTSETNDEKKIQRIVVFYKDGTFEEYQK